MLFTVVLTTPFKKLMTSDSNSPIGKRQSKTLLVKILGILSSFRPLVKIVNLTREDYCVTLYPSTYTEPDVRLQGGAVCQLGEEGLCRSWYVYVRLEKVSRYYNHI